MSSSRMALKKMAIARPSRKNKFRLEKLWNVLILRSIKISPSLKTRHAVRYIRSLHSQCRGMPLPSWLEQQAVSIFTIYQPQYKLIINIFAKTLRLCNW